MKVEILDDGYLMTIGVVKWWKCNMRWVFFKLDQHIMLRPLHEEDIKAFYSLQSWEFKLVFRNIVHKLKKEGVMSRCPKLPF